MREGFKTDRFSGLLFGLDGDLDHAEQAEGVSFLVKPDTENSIANVFSKVKSAIASATRVSSLSMAIA